MGYDFYKKKKKPKKQRNCRQEIAVFDMCSKMESLRSINCISSYNILLLHPQNSIKDIVMRLLMCGKAHVCDNLPCGCDTIK